MNKLLINICCWFIPKKKNKRHFREKHREKHREKIVANGLTINPVNNPIDGINIKSILDRVNKIEKILIFDYTINHLPSWNVSNFTKQITDQTEHIPIFLATDDNYLKYTATVMASILYNTNSFIDFYILENKITENGKNKLNQTMKKFNNFSIEYITISNDTIEIFKNTNKLNAHISVMTYIRFYIPSLKTNLDRAIYLDGDIVVLRDIKKLFDNNVDNFGIGAVKFGYLGDGFNAGVLLINCKKWRENNVLEELLKINKYLYDHERGSYNDQNVLNKYFKNDCLELDLKFNFINKILKYSEDKNDKSLQEMIIRGRNDIVLCHFADKNKPWNNTIDIYGKDFLYFKDWWFYTSMTEFYEEIKDKFIFAQ
ncbi:MAG: glycosyltransferase family 8 protein [Rickettsiales bacterium]|jgi:lipopolysaccharide biosynthesis glycosyltransferase|nr:glycosyltransferase family 8 protein [Rickettsiales bacterium]